MNRIFLVFLAVIMSGCAHSGFMEMSEDTGYSSTYTGAQLDQGVANGIAAGGVTGIVKSDGSNTISAAVAGTDYLSPSVVIDEDDMASDSSSHVPTQQSVKAYVDSAPGGGAGGSPGGSDTQIQYNNGGAFGGISSFIYDDTNMELADDFSLAFGTDADFTITYDETTDDQLEVVSNSASDTEISIANSGAGGTNLTIDGDVGVESVTIGGAEPPIIVVADADADPGVNDDSNSSSTAATPDVSGYSVGDVFINDTASPEKYWVCVGNTDGAADWDHLNPETTSLPYHQTAYFDPDAVYGRTGARVELDGNTTSALTITEIYVRLGEGADAFNDTELLFTFYQKTIGVDHSSPTTIGSGTTSSGVATITSFTDATVPADYMIWCVVGTDPDATTIEAVVVLEGTYD